MSDDLDQQQSNVLSDSVELSGQVQSDNNETTQNNNSDNDENQQNSQDDNNEASGQTPNDLQSSEPSLSGKEDDSDSDYTGKGGRTIQQRYQYREDEWSDGGRSHQRGKSQKTQRQYSQGRQTLTQSQQMSQVETLTKEQRFQIIIANLYILAKYYKIDDKLEEVTNQVNDSVVSQLIEEYQNENRDVKAATDAVCYNLKFQSCVHHFIQENGLTMLRLLLIPERLDYRTKFPQTQLVDHIFTILRTIRPDSFRMYYSEIQSSELIKYLNYISRFPQKYCPRQTIKRDATQLLKQWYTELLKAKQFHNKIDVGESSEDESGSGDIVVHNRYNRAINH